MADDYFDETGSRGSSGSFAARTAATPSPPPTCSSSTSSARPVGHRSAGCSPQRSHLRSGWRRAALRSYSARVHRGRARPSTRANPRRPRPRCFRDSGLRLLPSAGGCIAVAPDTDDDHNERRRRRHRCLVSGMRFSPRATAATVSISSSVVRAFVRYSDTPGPSCGRKRPMPGSTGCESRKPVGK